MIGYHSLYPNGESRIIFTGIQADDFPVSMTTEDGIICLCRADIPSLKEAIKALENYPKGDEKHDE